MPPVPPMAPLGPGVGPLAARPTPGPLAARPTPGRPTPGASTPGASTPGGPTRPASPALAVGPAPVTRPGYLPRPGYPPLPASPRAFGLPNLRRNVCPHFYLTGTRGALPIQAPHLLKALIRQDTNVSRCQLRGGVHLEQEYVNDVCLTARFNQCVFYEDELTKD